jgi:multiple sugar transport system permease protein
LIQTSATEAGAFAPASPALPKRRSKGRRKADWRRRRTVLGFMSPWILGFSIFFGYPLVMTIYLSVHHYDLLSSPKYIGFSNYQYLFGGIPGIQHWVNFHGTGDPYVWKAIRNTLWVIAFMVPLQVIFAFGIALMIARAKAGVGIFRTIFYLPALAPPVAATLAFVYILNPATGPVNSILGHLGINGPLWFNDPTWAKPSLTLLAMWGVGNTMIIFLAAILDVPKHLYESSEIDGAGPLQRLLYVTLPSISPVILFSVVIGMIQGLQYFTQAYVAGNIATGQASQAGDQSVNGLGYPENSTLMFPVLLYQDGFRSFRMGYASALSVLMLIVSFAVTLVIIVTSRRWVHYAGDDRRAVKTKKKRRAS